MITLSLENQKANYLRMHEITSHSLMETVKK